MSYAFDLATRSALDDVATHNDGLAPLPGDYDHDMVILAQAWQKLSTTLAPRDIAISSRRTKLDTPELQAAIVVLRERGLVESVFNDFRREVSSQFHLVERDIKRFMSQMSEAAALSVTPERQVHTIFGEMLDRLGSWYRTWGLPVKIMDDPEIRTLNSAYNAHFQLLLHSTLSSFTFLPYFRMYLAHSMPSSSSPNGSNGRQPSPSSFLYRLGFLPRYTDALVDIAFKEVERLVSEVSAETWEASHEQRGEMESPTNEEAGNAEAGPSGTTSGTCEPTAPEDTVPMTSKSLGKRPTSDLHLAAKESDIHTEPSEGLESGLVASEEDGPWGIKKLDKLRNRVNKRVLAWVLAYTRGHEGIYQSSRAIESRLDVKLLNDFFELRASELFDIIIDYPKSKPALEDLTILMQRTGRRLELVNALIEALRRRVLHPGADTRDILQVYISTIRTMRILDPQGAMLHMVANPIRANLRTRTDTVKCIVGYLVDNQVDEEGDEIDSMRPIQVRDDQAEDFVDPQWEPEPVDAAPEFRHHKSSDIISTLVGIFESRELVVKEIQNMLAARLLALKNYDLENEIRLVELLKLRFGDAALQVCQVMLKDMADSKRTDTHVQGEVESPLHPVVISRLYWPAMTHTAVRLPRRLKRMQRRYQEEFHRFKPDKYLKFLPHLGTVDIKLELEDRTVEVESTPLQATIIEYFSKQPRWHFTDLLNKLDTIEPTFLRHALNFWVNHGVLREDLSGCYELLETGALDGNGSELETGEPPIMQAATQHTAELVAFEWPDIRSILAVHGPQTTAQLAEALSQVDGREHSPAELERFLHGIRRDGLLQMDLRGELWELVDLSAVGRM